MHPVGEVTVDVEGQGRVADGDMELNLRDTDRHKIPLLHIFKLHRFIISVRYSV